MRLPWPPTQADGHRFLDELYAKLTPAEQRHREEAFEAAHLQVDRAAAVGGMPFSKKSFPKPARSDGRRVDIEVQKGVAFVPEPPEPEEEVDGPAPVPEPAA